MPETARSLFRQLAESFEEWSWSVESTWIFDTSKFPAPTDGQKKETKWKEEESSTRHTVDSALDKLLPSGAFPPLGQKEKYFLRLRLVAAYRFLYQFPIGEKSNLFPFPNMSVSEFSFYILKDWWREHGIDEAYCHIIEHPKP
jgi:hypothetical protein